MNLNNLPAVIDMSNLSILLGFNGNLDVAIVKKILLASTTNNLPIYFNSAMYGAKVSDGFAEEFDEDGDLKDVILMGSLKYLDSGRKTFIGGTPYSNILSVQKFNYDGIEYYSSDEHECLLTDVGIYLDSFYCDKEEFLASGLLSDNKSKKNISTKPQVQPVQEQREGALKNWLATKANLTIEDDKQYQACYKAIGEPTQKEIWEKLQGMEIKLFAAGFDDFFKYQKIIDFKIGTGARRRKKL